MAASTADGSVLIVCFPGRVQFVVSYVPGTPNKKKRQQTALFQNFFKREAIHL
jgi:hypothetical protein